MRLSDLYKKVVIEHNRDPRNFREMADATHEARGLNALCGDDIRVFLRVSQEDVIEQITFSGDASAITMAATSIMTEALAGCTLRQALERYDRYLELFAPEEPSQGLLDELGDLAALSGVRAYPSRIKSATLGWETLRAAIERQAIASTE